MTNKCGVQMIDCPECSHQWDHFFECGNQPGAEPVPLAGGEPDRYDHAEEDMEESAFGEYVTYECYEADVTRLQAEVERLKQVAIDLKNEQTKLCTERNDLQSELTQARELLIPAECPHMIVFDDADREPLTFAGEGARAAALKTWEQISGSWNAHLFVRVERNSRDDRYPSANQSAPADKGRGEPVGVVVQFGKGLKEVSWAKGKMPEIGTKLYAEQPAPVAVVIPELVPTFEAWWESDGQYCRAGGGDYEKTFAYRAYENALAEVARLNQIKQ